MKRNQKRVRGRYFPVILLLLLCMIKEPVYAAPGSTSGKITIELTENMGTKKGVAFKLYKVGTWVPPSEQWKLEGGLTGSSLMQLTNASSSTDWKNAAESLAGEVKNSSLPETKSGKTSENGTLTFDSLEEGMYLVVQEGDNAYGTISPFLVALPYKQNETESDEVTAKPKAEPLPQPGGKEHQSSEVSRKDDTPSKEDDDEEEDDTTFEGVVGESVFRNDTQNSAVMTLDNKITSLLRQSSQSDKSKNKPVRWMQEEQEQESVSDETVTDNREVQENESQDQTGNPASQENSGTDTDDHKPANNQSNHFAVATFALATTAAATSGGIVLVKRRRRK